MKDRAEGKRRSEVIGLIPAGGQATRISPLPCSKELFPIGFSSLDDEHGLRPKVACQYLLEKMRFAGITKAYIVLREGKWDIPAYLRDGEIIGVRLAYLIRNLPFGVPYTLDQAYHFIQDALVALGFPDILFDSEDAFTRVLVRQAVSEADIVLGLFPADQPQKVDMVDLNDAGQIQRILIKPHKTPLSYTWGLAVWTPAFTHFMHEFLGSRPVATEKQQELFVGDLFQAAIDNGLRAEAVHIADTPYLDIGTPEDLVRAVKSAVV